MSVLEFVAWGQPIGQGAHSRNRYGATYETTKGHAPWRKELIRAATQAITDIGWRTLADAVHVDITCYGPRPKSHYGTGRNAGILKADAPAYPITQGRYGSGLQDTDHLARSILDALKLARVIDDDSLVTDLHIRARYAEQPVGARAVIRVYPQPALVGA